MEGAAARKELDQLDYLLGADNQDDQMYREQHMAPTHDPRRPSTRANKPGLRTSTEAEVNQGQEPGVAVHRRLKLGFVSSAFRTFTCQSPSTDSTTSLLQLRDKLNVLSPLLFNKVTHKIATSPELPVLNELDEHENLNNSFPKTKRCGVSVNYHSDSEAQAQIIKRTRCLSPVVEEHSARLVLTAALGNADVSVTNDSLERLFKDHPNFNLPDLLLEEALHHGQEKDSGIISGKVTQDSDVVENTPVEKEVRHKQLSKKRNAKSIVQDEPAFDETEVEVIEDTPCYVYDRKERVRTNNTNADFKIISEEIVTLEETAIDAFFSQHVKHNKTENVISPTLAKKINETSSEASDDDCIIVEDHFMEEELSVNNSVFEADIIDCVNSVIDKVCNDLDTCFELLAEQERHIDNLSFAKNIEDNSNIGSDIFKTSKDKLKPDKDTSYEHNNEEIKKVTLKFKKVAPKMNTRKKPAKNYKDPIDIRKSNVLVESTNTSSPLNSIMATLTRKKRKLYSPKDDENENKEITTPKTRVERGHSNVNETPIATCYRELEHARQSHSRIPKKSRASIQAKKSKKSRYNMSSESEGEDPSFQIRKRTSSSSIGSTTMMSRRERSKKIGNYIDSHYSTMHSSSEEDDFKQCRTIKPKTASKIKPRGRKVEKKSRTQPILSPKTKKLNEMFDKIKDNVVNDEKITLVEKKSVEKDPFLYNLSSESEDGDFKKKKNQVQKRISSSSLESSATKRRRLLNRVNYSKYYSSEDEDKGTQKSLESSATKRRRLLNRVNYSKYYSSEDEDKGTQKSKTVKQAKPKSRKMNKIPKFNLIDERMRAAQQETLETSFVKDTFDTNNLEEPEPAFHQAPVLEDMRPDKPNDDETEAVLLENKTQTPKKLAVSKIKNETKLSKTCEKVTRSIATKKAKEISKIVSKEKDSAPVSPLPGLVVETEKTRHDDLTSSIEANLLQKCKKIYTDVRDSNQTDDTRHLLLNVDENDDAVLEPSESIVSERSIATGGRSPITAHNDLNESPPNVGLLDEDFQHRDVHNEDMSESMAEFLTNMRNQLQANKPTAASLTSPVIPITRMSTKESVRSNLCAKRMSSEESIHKSIAYAESNKSNPKVVLERIPTKQIEPKLDPIGSPKSKVSSGVLTRISSQEIEKYMTPTHSIKTRDTSSPKIVLERMSSDEINKWLPMPESKDVVDTGEKPKKYSTRQTSKLTETKIPTKRQTSKPPETKTPVIVIERKIKPKISPVKLSFDIVDLTMSADDRVRRALRTRSSTKSTKSHATNIDKEHLTTDSIKSSVPKAQTSKKDQSFVKNSQETNKSSVVTKSKSDKAPASVDIASVEGWFQRNATPTSPSAADNLASREMLCQIMEAIDTTLAEIDQATAESFTAALLKNHEEINRVQEKIAEMKTNQMERVCEVIRAAAEKKARMVKLLKEDIQRQLDYLRR